MALRDLPKSLPETFSRILDDARGYGPADQARLLKLVVASLRPLSTEEIREVMSVTHFDTAWDTSKLINTLRHVLATCGCLLIVDEEDKTLHLVHPSVEQFLLGDFDRTRGGRFAHEEAELEMANTVLTYLNYDIFNTQLTRSRVPAPAMNISRTILSGIRDSDSTRAISLALLRGSERRVRFDIGRALARFDNQSRQRDTFSFHPYAKTFFLDHTTNLERCSPRLLPLLLALWKTREVGKNDSDFSDAVESSSYVDAAQKINYSVDLPGPGSGVVYSGTTRTVWIREKRLVTWRVDSPLHWGLYRAHIGVFRAGHRCPRTGIYNVCRLALDYRRGFTSQKMLDGCSKRPWFILRLLWLAATFKIKHMYGELLRRLQVLSSWTIIYQETSALAEDHPALSLISDARAGIFPNGKIHYQNK